MKQLLFILTLFFTVTLFSQERKKIKLKKYRVCYLPDSLIETSGLCFFKNNLLTLNDGGNPNEIFEINSINGKILKKIKTDLVNIDWEAIAFTNDTLYIGDFGNNLGNRKNLSITQLTSKDSLQFQSFRTFHFDYTQQKEFTNKPLQHNFDCEAMIVQQNNIHLFSKEWKSKTTSHYTIELSETKKQTLTKTEEFNTRFLVTDAYFFENKLYLIGYTRMGKIVLMIFNCDENLRISHSNFKKYKLGSTLNLGQIEGIAVNTNGIYISAEGFKKLIFKSKPSLYFIPFSDL